MNLCRCLPIVTVLLLAPGPPATAQMRENVRVANVVPHCRNQQWYQELAVIHAGQAARPFVEAEGADAARALLACSYPVAFQLVRFYESGGLGRLPRPHELLKAITESDYGSDIAIYAIRHSQELSDPTCFEIFMRSPVEYVLDVKSLPEEMAVFRNGRMRPSGVLQSSSWDTNRRGEWRAAALLLGVTIVAVLIVRWLKERREEWFT